MKTAREVGLEVAAKLVTAHRRSGYIESSIIAEAIEAERSLYEVRINGLAAALERIRREWKQRSRLHRCDPHTVAMLALAADAAAEGTKEGLSR